MSDALDPLSAEPARVRVRTPGKHVVLWSLTVTFMIGVSTLLLSKADLALPAQPFVSAAKPVDETFVTDLAADAQGRLRFLTLVIRIDAADAAALEANRPAIRERISFFLRELTPEDLDGTPAQERLKAELQRRIALSIAPGAVSGVTIQSMIIQ